MTRFERIWGRLGMAALLAVTVPCASRAENLLRASAYDMPTGLRLSAGYSELAGSPGSDSLRTWESYVEKRPALRTASWIVSMNLVMTLYGRYIMQPDGYGFRVSGETIKNNLQNGFEWDDNSFSANNFRHPYQGAQYHGVARGNGYDFYESSLWSFFGAWEFEYAGEAHHPSYNDWINTAVGGIALGEVLFRLQNMVLDNTATGSERAWREIGGLAVHPLREVNRLVTGEAFDVHQNPADRFPSSLGGELVIGTRTIGEERLWEENVTKAFLSFDAKYGDPYDDIRKPYEAFQFGAQVTFDNKPRGLARLEASGVIASADVYKSDVAQHVLSAVQLFDYFDNEAYTYGGQTIGVNYRSRFWRGDLFEARTTVGLGAILLGASRSDYFNISGREYDYGPGAGYGVSVEFARRGRTILGVSHNGFWIHSVNGTNSDHYNNVSRFRLDLPAKQFFSAGVEYVLFHSERIYADYDDVSTRNPELKLYLSWLMD